MPDIRFSSTYKQMVVDGGNEMIDRGLTVGTWGNLSIRDPETGLIYLKPSAMRYDQITVDDIVVMNPAMEIVAGTRKPTIEYQFHIGIMNARSDVNAVIHTHPIYSAAIGTLGWDLPAVSEDFVQLVGEKIVCCEYALPGSPGLADNLVLALGEERYAAMIPNHGTVCCGKDWNMVMKVCFVVEKAAQIYLLAKSVGTPAMISSEDIAAMREFARHHYGQ